MFRIDNEKCKRQITKIKKKLPSQERMRQLEEKGNYKYVEILEADIIKQAEMK